MAAARSFPALIALLQRAETALVRAGQTDPAERVTTLRGLFYGTDWSTDSRVEHASVLRTIGFFVYTGLTLPADPRPALGASLFADLQASQSIADRGRVVDIGHALIGMDARLRVTSRTIPIPSQGGTGLQIVTWLGDLGGGAAHLAFLRATNPRQSVASVFVNRASDYGTVDNLEGDVAGHLIACDDSPGGPLVFPPGTGIADAVATYLPGTTSVAWTTRAARFAATIGLTAQSGRLVVSSGALTAVAQQIWDFAVFYLTTRYIAAGQLRGPQISIACKHLRGASTEVATVFLRTLATAVASPSVSGVRASAPWPAATPPGQCESSILAAAATDVSSSLKKQLHDLGGDLRQLLP